MSKLSAKYFFWTFGIMLLCWGTCIAFSMNGISLTNNSFLYIPYILGGFSPTIASYILLKQNGQVKSLKGWLKGIFDFKHKPTTYTFVIALSIAYVLPLCLISGYHQSAPLYFMLLLVPQMIVGGGMEEAGWRHILQPELEKRFNFAISTIIVSVIWWLWHLPLFLMAGTAQFDKNFWTFGISVLGLSFALSAIKKKTNSTWLCILFHAFANAWSGLYMVNDHILGTVVSSAALILISSAWVKMGGGNKLRT